MHNVKVNGNIKIIKSFSIKYNFQYYKVNNISEITSIKLNTLYIIKVKKLLILSFLLFFLYFNLILTA